MTTMVKWDFCDHKTLKMKIILIYLTRMLAVFIAIGCLQTTQMFAQSKSINLGLEADPADASSNYQIKSPNLGSFSPSPTFSEKGKGNEKMLVMGCDLTTYQSATLIGPGDFPYTSPGTGVTVSVSTDVTTISNTTYSCDGNSFACSNPAWWLNSASQSIVLTFSAPVTDFSVVVNGTNQDELFTFTAATGTISLDNFCTASFAVTGGGNQLVDNVSTTTGTLITVLNPTGSTQYTITHNGVGAGSRITLLDCFQNEPGCVNPFVSLPANGASTVACLALATQPTPPNGTDQDGNSVSPSSGPTITDNPNPLSCEGTRTYTWTYMDCEGTEYFWSYVYTIERNPFTITTPNGASTVSCHTLATQPTPPTVMSDCGETLTPTGPAVTENPAPLFCNGTRTYTWTYTDCAGNSAQWSYVYTIDRNPFTITTPNGASTISCLSQAVDPAPPTVLSDCGETLNPAGPFVFDNPNPAVCEGTRTFTYTYTDCEGNTADWSYVYTIERNPFTITTPNGASTVSCLSQATAPMPPTVVSDCGETLNPTGPFFSDNPNPLSCEGTRTYTYTYTDCEGNTADWSYVYTIERNPFTTPANGSATVNCVSEATPPTLPMVTSDCGETLAPSAPVITDSPSTIDCGGSRTYSYTYTDCEGNTDTWSFVYTISPIGGVIKPADGASTVPCVSQAVEPTPPTVTNNCGVVLDPDEMIVTDAPDPITCEGTRTYTWNYFDCDENEFFWNYVYTIQRNPISLPADGASTVTCASAATTPTPPTVMGDCGETLMPTGPIVTDDPNPITCNGTRTYAYTYTDCTGNSATWNYVYTVSPTGGITLPPDGEETVNCVSEITAPMPPTGMGDCGEMIPPSGPTITDEPNPLSCSGTRTYTYTYTDCAGGTATWNYVYTVNPTGGYSLPPDGASTVSCPALATMPTPPTVMDVCGNIVEHGGVEITENPDPVTCEGTITYSWNYSDCLENISVWSYTYTIERNPFTISTPNGASTIACLAQAIQPAPPTVMSDCGETLTPTGPVVTDSPNPVTCEGTRTYTYTYTDCEGNQASWSFVYTIERNPFTISTPNGASTVACPTLATQPTPPTVMSDCGETLTPSGPVVTENPNPLICEGTRTYTYTYTDCEGNQATWSYVYTIELPPFTINTPNGASTVACPDQATEPAPPTVMSNCGEPIYPTGPFVTENPSPLSCEGTRTYTYVFTDCAGHQASWDFVYTIERNDFSLPANDSSTVACVALAVYPTLPTVQSNCGETLMPTDLVIVDNPNPLICGGTRTYIYTYTDCEGNSHDWMYKYTITPSTFMVPADGASTVSCPSMVTTPTPPVVSDGCGNPTTPTGPVITMNPEPLSCEGTVTYTYTYVDCSGNMVPWNYIYTIERNDFSVPQNGSATVSCVAQATTPTPPAVQSDCGETLTPTGPVVTDNPNPLLCGGTRTYTWTYTDCEGNTHNWSFVYTVTPVPFVVPANGAATVACPALATQPTPPVVNDACGNPTTPTGPVITNNPNPLSCEGTRTYTWTYTDCAGNMTPWSFVYTIEREPFTVPANGAATVACLALVTTPTPPTVMSNCGETLPTPTPVITDSPNPLTCEGTRTYAYTYTDCEGNQATWSYVYTIEREPFTISTPNGASTVACPALAVAPTPPVVMSDCGETLPTPTPVITNIPNPLTCEGARTYAYTYTDCEGNTATWSYAYTIEREPFTIPANGAATVACPANATQPTPPTVQSNCGEVLTPTGPVITNNPNPLTCEGTRTYAWTYTDCEGNTATWSFVYTIEREPFAISTPNGAATVACPNQTDVQPTPPVVTSNCGEVLTPVVTSTAKPGCEGNRNWIFTYTDCEGNTATWVFIYTVEYQDFSIPASEVVSVGCPINVVQPVPPAVIDNCGKELTAMGPVITTTNNASGCEGSRKYEWTYKDCEGNSHVWSKTFNIEYDGDFFVYPDGETAVGCLSYAEFPPVPPTVYGTCGEVAHVSGPTITESVDPSGCSGTRKFTFIYTDCGGHSHPWSFTYHAEDTEPPVGTCPDGLVDVVNLSCIDDVPCPDDYDFSSKINELIAAGGIYDVCSGNNIKVELDSWSSLWQCTDLLGDGVYTFGRTFYFRIADQCGNEMPSLCSVTYSGKCLPLQTFTQSEWGNEGDAPHVLTPSDTTDLQTITGLLSELGPLKIGGSHRSLTLTDAQCLMNLLPSAGNPTTLSNCHQTNCSGCNPAGPSGLKNSMAANTIALILNMRYNVKYNELTMTEIRNQSLGCIDIDQNIKTCTDNGDCELQLFETNGVQHVFPYTIGGLLDLANLFLDGDLALTPGAKLVYASAINSTLVRVNAFWHDAEAQTNCQQDAGMPFTADNAGDKALPNNPVLVGNQTFSLSPNPASSEVNIKLTGLVDGEMVTFELFNQLGQRVMQIEFGKVQFLNERIDLSGIKSGLYIVSLKAGANHFEEKLVIGNGKH
ncbi:MAG: T9SS type A sorting domain-containing protein [Bacteroidetes bacterium]|nr:T9SS type A sorting domain-containing protein [Bacteroidota bacterium]